MTLADRIERVLGEERFRKIREYTFSDTARKIFGEERYPNIKRILYQYLVEKDHLMPSLDKPARMTYRALKKFDEWLPLEKLIGERASPKLRHAMHKVLVDTEYSKMPDKVAKGIYEVLRKYANKTYYEVAANAVAQNLASLVYILNDKFIAGQSWWGALGTRASAAVGNTLTGDFYKDFQDYFIAKADKDLKISEDPNKYRRFAKNWITKASAFVYGQSWLYALFLLGGNALAGEPTDYNKLLGAVVTLTALAPLLGPLQDKVYQFIRVQFGLPAVSKYREEQQKQIGTNGFQKDMGPTSTI